MTGPAFRIDQVGILVRDLDEALRAYDDILQPDSWSVWTYGPRLLHTQTLRGEPAAFEMKVALSEGLVPQVELIQPLGGPNAYEEWIAVHGPGLHHLGMFRDDFHEARTEMQGRGFSEVQSGEGQGLDGDGGFAYFDTVATLGFLLEIIHPPVRRHPPEFVWSGGRRLA